MARVLYRPISIWVLILSCVVLPSIAYTQAPEALPELIDLAWSPDSNFIIGGGTNGLLRLWDAATGNVLDDFQGISGNVYSVAWSPDSANFVSAGADRLIHIWDIEAREEITTLEGHLDIIISTAWSSDGEQIISASFSEETPDLSLRIWDARTYEQLNAVDAGPLTEIAWSPVAQELAIANLNGYIFVDEVISADFIRRLEIPDDLIPFSVSWSPDGTSLAVGNYDGTISIINAAIGDLLTTIEADTSAITEIAWSSEGTILASSSFAGTVKLWNVDTESVIETIQQETVGYAVPIAWNPNGTQFAYGTANAEINIIPAP